MRREVKRRRKLPVFRLDLPAFQDLLVCMTGLFAIDPRAPTIRLRSRNEELLFEGIEDLVAATSELPARVSDFSVHYVCSDSRSLLLESSGFLGSQATITAEGPDFAWCAGASATVVQRLRQHSRWYGPIRGWPLGAMVLITANLPMLSRLTGTSLFRSWAATGAWAAVLGTSLALYISRRRLLPVATLDLRSSEAAVRRYMPEITLAVAILALLLTVLGWFVAR